MNSSVRWSWQHLSTPNKNSAKTNAIITSLEDPYGQSTPANVFREMGEYLKEAGDSIKWDVYGDFDQSSDGDSFPRQSDPLLSRWMQENTEGAI